jgi:hypothetical protein
VTEQTADEVLQSRLKVAMQKKDDAKAAVEAEWERFKARLPEDCPPAMEIGLKLAFSAGLAGGFRKLDELNRAKLEELARMDHVLVYLGAIHEITQGLSDLCRLSAAPGEKTQ